MPREMTRINTIPRAKRASMGRREREFINM
jgi:hypothetical protein